MLIRLNQRSCSPSVITSFQTISNLSIFSFSDGKITECPPKEEELQSEVAGSGHPHNTRENKLVLILSHVGV